MKMNCKKLLSLAGAACFCLTGVHAAGNEKGIEYYRAELYSAAKLFFMQQTNQNNTEKAENYYYLGQTYAATQQLDSASYYYTKSVEADTEYPFAYIGKGKIALSKKDMKGAEELFKEAIGFAKKDPSIYTTIAEAYIDEKQYDKAEEMLDRARKAKKNYSGIFVAEGDMLMSQGKSGDALGRYDNAILFDKNDKVAYLKQARVYKGINADAALKYLNDLIAIDPEYVPAYAELGEIYYSTGFYGKAIDAYQKIIVIPGVPLESMAKYAQLLYFTDKYAESLVEIRKVLAQDPTNFVARRLQVYNNFKLENFELGLEQMDKFMKEADPTKLIPQDYITYGRLLLKAKQPEAAVQNLLKVLELPDVKAVIKTEVYKDVADAYKGIGDYVSAIPYWEKFLESSETDGVREQLLYGVDCFSAAAQLKSKTPAETQEQLLADSTLRVEILQKADKAFAKVAELSPSSYQGYLWRGHVSAVMDNDEYERSKNLPGLAKPYYEQALTIMLEKNENGARNKDIITCYNYFASFYLLLDDSKTSGEYWKKILEIDPNNQAAKQTLDALKIKY